MVFPCRKWEGVQSEKMWNTSGDRQMWGWERVGRERWRGSVQACRSQHHNNPSLESISMTWGGSCNHNKLNNIYNHVQLLSSKLYMFRSACHLDWSPVDLNKPIFQIKLYRLTPVTNLSAYMIFQGQPHLYPAQVVQCGKCRQRLFPDTSIRIRQTLSAKCHGFTKHRLQVGKTYISWRKLIMIG